MRYCAHQILPREGDKLFWQREAAEGRAKMFAKKLVATGTCAVLAAGFLGMAVQAAPGDAAYTQMVNKAIITSDVYGNNLLAENGYVPILAQELTGTKLTGMVTNYYNYSYGEDINSTFAYEYDASGVQTSGAVFETLETDYDSDEGPTVATTTYDAAGYPTQIAVTEPAYYTMRTWYSKTYQNTYDEAGRLTGVTTYTVQHASDPQPIELSTPTSIYSITYDEAGRVSTIASHVNIFATDYETGEMYLDDDAEENLLVYGYNELNEVVTCDYAYTAGEFESSTSHNEYTYNDLGEVLTHTRVDSYDLSSLAANTQYVYDANGVLQQDYEIDDPTQNTVYAY